MHLHITDSVYLQIFSNSTLLVRRLNDGRLIFIDLGDPIPKNLLLFPINKFVIFSHLQAREKSGIMNIYFDATDVSFSNLKWVDFDHAQFEIDRFIPKCESCSSSLNGAAIESWGPSGTYGNMGNNKTTTLLCKCKNVNYCSLQCQKSDEINHSDKCYIANPELYENEYCEQCAPR